jgi:hypothetical protein
MEDGVLVIREKDTKKEENADKQAD